MGSSEVQMLSKTAIKGAVLGHSGALVAAKWMTGWNSTGSFGFLALVQVELPVVPRPGWNHRFFLR